MANPIFFGLLLVITISVIFCDSSPSFKPKLQWICIPSGIFLTIKTVEPFNGIANAVGHRLNCSKEGHGQTNTYMIINFYDGKQCGVKYENQTGTYWVEVEVHYSKVLLLEQDAIFNVTCENSSMLYYPYFGFSLDLFSSPINNDSTTNQSKDAENGQSYVLHAYLERSDDSIKYRNRFQMTNCFVEGDQQNPIEIIDSNGCSTDLKLISDVEYVNGYASVKLSSINPYLKMVTLKCKFAICDSNETCQKRCERHWYDSPLKSIKNIANWIGFNTIAASNDDSQESSPPPAIIDRFISSDYKLDDRRQTIVQLLIPLQTDNFSQQPQKNVFIQRCYKFLFGQCYSYDDILWLDVVIYFGLNNFFGLIALILILCYQTFKADSHSEEGDFCFFDKTGNHGTKGKDMAMIFPLGFKLFKIFDMQQYHRPAQIK